MKPPSQSPSLLTRHLSIKDSSRKQKEQVSQSPSLLRRRHTLKRYPQKTDATEIENSSSLEPEAIQNYLIPKHIHVSAEQMKDIDSGSLKRLSPRQNNPPVNRIRPIRIKETARQNGSLRSHLKTQSNAVARSPDTTSTLDIKDSLQISNNNKSPSNKASLLRKVLITNENASKQKQNLQLAHSTYNIRRNLSFRGTLYRANSLSSYVFNVVVMGRGKVGKTALVKQYINGEYPSHHVATTEDMYEKQIRRDKKPKDASVYVLRIFDTAGTFSFPAMRRLTIRKGDAFLLVYAIDDAKSFEEIKHLREEILSLKDEQSIPTVVIGNKSDLPSSNWVVNSTAGLALAREWNCCFAEISAKNISSVEQIFQVLFREFEKQERRELESNTSLVSMKDFEGQTVIGPVNTTPACSCKVFCSIM